MDCPFAKIHELPNQHYTRDHALDRPERMLPDYHHAGRSILLEPTYPLSRWASVGVTWERH